MLAGLEVASFGLALAAACFVVFSFRRRARHREAARMLAFAVIENFGYRQLVDFWRTLALLDVVRRRRGWEEMGRRGLSGRESVLQRR